MDTTQRDGRWHEMNEQPSEYKDLWLELSHSSVAAQGIFIRSGLCQGYWRQVQVGMLPAAKITYEVCKPLRWAYVVRPELVDESEE